MKKLLCLLLALLLVPVLSFAEEDELPLSDYEKSFIGGWSMYASLQNGTVYHFSLTFLEDRSVYYRTLMITDGEPSYNVLASGQFMEFLSDSIILDLAGKTYLSNIVDGILRLVEFDTMTICGFYSPCEDMSYKIAQ